MTGETLLKRAEVLKCLGISAKTLRAIIRSGDLAAPVTLPGGGRRYLQSSVDAFLKGLLEQHVLESGLAEADQADGN
ncbi:MULTISPECIES: helix-turn-helix transcriptional regulator [Pseudomonas]|uniref:Helix-turn-helix domain-containing protein n=1 Tax=Pseudomonas lutea TaxID=243924 RepID=A0A9X8MHT8_9PSED|nr:MULTISPECIES: helix-turn-helix domain-containing protein [Pseudomonas]SER49200.1 Helix-turn-helix domain-containing protein [Pseudomonas lutea]